VVSCSPAPPEPAPVAVGYVHRLAACSRPRATLCHQPAANLVVKHLQGPASPPACQPERPAARARGSRHAHTQPPQAAAWNSARHCSRAAPGPLPSLLDIAYARPSVSGMPSACRIASAHPPACRRSVQCGAKLPSGAQSHSRGQGRPGHEQRLDSLPAMPSASRARCLSGAGCFSSSRRADPVDSPAGAVAPCSGRKGAGQGGWARRAGDGDARGLADLVVARRQLHRAARAGGALQQRVQVEGRVGPVGQAAGPQDGVRQARLAHQPLGLRLPLQHACTRRGAAECRVGVRVRSGGWAAAWCTAGPTRAPAARPPPSTSARLRARRGDMGQHADAAREHRRLWRAWPSSSPPPDGLARLPTCLCALRDPP